MIDTTHKCSKRVYDPRTFRGHQCTIAAKVERDGKWYCKRHDPEAVAKRRQEQEKKWREKWDREAEESRREQDAAAEQKRRADAYHTLLGSLIQVRECLHDIATAKEGERWGWDWESVISDADSAIANARGEA